MWTAEWLSKRRNLQPLVFCDIISKELIFVKIFHFVYLEGGTVLSKSRERVGGYRGRRTLTDILRLIAILLGILVLVVLVGLVFGQRFIVYSDDGLRLELPFLQQEEPELPEIKPGDINMIERPGSSGASSEEMQPPETPVFVLSAMELDLADIQNGTAEEKLNAAGANAVVLEMKDVQGKLHWESQQKLAVDTQVNGAQANNEILEQWLQGDVYTVAKICCFRDNTIPYQRNNMALRATYGNWRDELGLRWMNPAGEDTQLYLSSLCRELAEMGFDEILLECYAFPGLGAQEAITTQAPQGRARAVEVFLERVRQEVSEYGSKLSVLVEPGVLSGTETASEVTGELLKQHADCLWVDETEASIGQHLFEEESDRLVCIRERLDGQMEGPQACLNS